MSKYSHENHYSIQHCKCFFQCFLIKSPFRYRHQETASSQLASFSKRHIESHSSFMVNSHHLYNSFVHCRRRSFFLESHHQKQRPQEPYSSIAQFHKPTELHHVTFKREYRQSMVPNLSSAIR